jgi:hypothetical protein
MPSYFPHYVLLSTVYLCPFVCLRTYVNFNSVGAVCAFLGPYCSGYLAGNCGYNEMSSGEVGADMLGLGTVTMHYGYRLMVSLRPGLLLSFLDRPDFSSSGPEGVLTVTGAAVQENPVCPERLSSQKPGLQRTEAPNQCVLKKGEAIQCQAGEVLGLGRSAPSGTGFFETTGKQLCP